MKTQNLVTRRFVGWNAGRWSIASGTCGCVAFGAALFGVITVGLTLFTKALIAGPRAVLPTAAVGPDIEGVVTFTPTELASTGLRWGWNTATAMVLFGIAMTAWAGVHVVRSFERSGLLFLPAKKGRVSLQIQGAFLLIIFGGVARNLLDGHVIGAAGVDDSVTNDGYSLWIFSVPSLAWVVLVAAMAWMWSHGESLETDAELVV